MSGMEAYAGAACCVIHLWISTKQTAELVHRPRGECLPIATTQMWPILVTVS